MRVIDQAPFKPVQVLWLEFSRTLPHLITVTLDGSRSVA